MRGAPSLVHLLWRIRKSPKDSAYLRAKWNLSFLINPEAPRITVTLAAAVLVHFPVRLVPIGKPTFSSQQHGLHNPAGTVLLVGPHVSVPTATTILPPCLRPNQVPKIERHSSRTQHPFGFLWVRLGVTKSPDIERDDARVGERARFRVGCTLARTRSSPRLS